MNESRFFVYDVSGSLRLEADATGSIVSEVVVDPFGNILGSTSGASEHLAFIGQYGVRRDLNDLVYMRARYYMPSLGRFMSSDPIRLAGGDTNFYAYAENDPVGQSDASGLFINVLYHQQYEKRIRGALKSLGDGNTAEYERLMREADYYRCLRDASGDASAAIPGIIPTGATTPQWAAKSLYKKFVGWMFSSPADPSSPPPRCVPPVPPPSPVPATPSGEPRETHAPLITVPQSFDPNDILGPDGVGAERWISAANPINYTIRFENDPLLANAAAQVVVITQTLDADLDARSFRLGTFGFSGFLFEVPDNRAYYSTRLDLRETYGIYVDVFAGVDVIAGNIFWQFTSIDPLTGEVPIDRFIGFLPPNLTAPEGDGFVSYTISAKETAVTGDRVDALATIVFDSNAPIDTPPIFNTLDVSGPTSTVAALPASVDDRRFRVNWSGGDGAIGSGLSSFDVFVSRDGGAFQLWLDDTTLTEAEYTGEFGSTYAFYSVARDNVGNVEVDIEAADTVTVVGALAPMLEGVTINDGNVQRSMVNSLTITFSSPVTFQAGAISIVRRVKPLNFTFTYTNPSGDGMTWVVMFSGQSTQVGSLADGMYDLIIRGDLVKDQFGQTLQGGDQTVAFHRLFGDVDGNAIVDALDLHRLRSYLGSRQGDDNFVWWLDFDGSGTIDEVDALRARANLGLRLF
jgi:RHS repeat-associated protein